jgi:hypothetical protein
MDTKVSKKPIVGLIGATFVSILIFSVAQYHQRKATQETAVDALRAAHAETEAAMKAIAQSAITDEQHRTAAADAAYRATPQYRELQRLEAADRQWLADHPQ